MSWTVVNVEYKKSSRGTPAASIGFGRIALNVAACELLDNFQQFKFIELLTDKDRPSVVGIRFLIEETENSLPIRRRISSGKVHSGIDITSKFYVEKLFGIKGTQQKTTTYSVARESDSILVVYIE